LGFIHDVNRAASETQDAYLSLCWLLLAVLADDHDPGEVGRMAGRLIGKAALNDGSGAPDDALVRLVNFLEADRKQARGGIRARMLPVRGGCLGQPGLGLRSPQGLG